MATLTFYLKPVNKKHQYPIMLCYQDRGKKFRFFTKLFSGRPGLQNNRIKAVSLADFETNEKLKAFEEIIKNIEKEAVLKGIWITVEDVEVSFRAIVARDTTLGGLKAPLKEHSSEFFDYYDQFVEQSKATKAKSTIAHYKMCKSNLLSFQQELRKPISFNIINGKFYEGFSNYMITKRKLKENYEKAYFICIDILNYEYNL